MTRSLLYPTVVSLIILIIGCSHLGGDLKNTSKRATALSDELAEQSRSFTAGAKDALSYAPTNGPTELAREMLAADQTIEGLPIRQINVKGILSGDPEAVAEYGTKLNFVQGLISDRYKLQLELSKAKDQLVSLGLIYEAEKNKSIFRRSIAAVIGTIGIGGSIALIVLFPALIPILGSLVAWFIGVVPRVAGFLQVVGKKAFDGVVEGVQNVRLHLAENGTKQFTGKEVLEIMDQNLKQSTDRPHRVLISDRKTVLKLKRARP